MLIVGGWELLDDVVRPVVRATVRDARGAPIFEPFLVDSGAEQTVLSGSLREFLGLPEDPDEILLAGVSGSTMGVVIETAIEFMQHDGTPVIFRGKYAAMRDPDACDISILGFNVLQHFDLILSWPRKEVSLIRDRHAYQIVGPS